MPSPSLSHLSDEALLRAAAAVITRDRATTAELLTYLAEIDERKLYLPAAYPSMFAFCVGELRMEEDAAARRLRAARVARRCPGVLPALAEGHVSLTTVLLLGPHLTPENEADLLAAAMDKGKGEVEQLLAERFPRLPEPARLTPVAAGGTAANCRPALAPVGDWPVGERRARVTPLAPESFALHCTLNREAHEDLRQAQALLGHQVGSGDLGVVVARALKLLVGHLQKRKFGATAQPRQRSPRPSTGSRHIPAEVKRTVWQRDGGQCTFVGENGRRCGSRARIEFDHVEPVALGGTATVGGIRLRCRAHNQYEAERTFGADFMRHQRDTAQAAARAKAVARPDTVPQLAEDDEKDVVPWLRALGYRADQARYAAERCADLPDEASLEERVRVALSMFRVRTT